MAVIRIVVMGVAGSGKTTVAARLAERLGADFLDADDFHPPSNVAKMAAGEALTDEDRWPWLARLRGELRERDRVVLACSALRRSYRDVLRGADDVRFVFLDADPGTATGRAAHRGDHFMGAGMVAGQFDALERPAADETDVATLDATESVDELVTEAQNGLATTRRVRRAAPLIADGAVDRMIRPDELRAHITEVAAVIERRGARSVLLVPPDQTRSHSQAGPITVGLRAELRARGCTVGVLPALGTHARMSVDDAAMLFGPGLEADDLLFHDWRAGVVRLGAISADEVAVATGGRFAEPIEVAADAQLFDGWDLVVSIGQVVPHEVIGISGFTKNVVIGLGGAPTIHRTHFVGAVAGMESLMGRATSPVRDLVDAAFDRFIAPRLDVMWILTVVEDLGATIALRGLFVGEGRSSDSGGAAFAAAAALAVAVNVSVVDRPLDRVVCRLDPREFRSTWLGNKAVYRTRMAIADGGELVVLAPGVRRFGEDEVVDGLIRRHGYRGTAAALAAVDGDADLAANLGAAAHLIHGSSEGRFRIVYCTDPAAGGLTAEEVESVGYEWRSLPDELTVLALDADAPSGPRLDRDGRPYDFIANPALGLWTVAGAGVPGT